MNWLEDTGVLEQGSEEWHKFRSKHIGASDVPAIMQMCDFRNPYDVFLTKMPDYVPGEQTWPMMRGHALEPVALAMFEMRNNCTLTKPVAEKGIFHASLDGWWEEEKAVIEVKAPALWKHTMALCGLVPETYQDQLQAQMFVTGAEKAYYVSFHPDEPESHQYAQILVLRDDKRIEFIKERCMKFWEMVEEKVWSWRDLNLDRLKIVLYFSIFATI